MRPQQAGHESVTALRTSDLAKPLRSVTTKPQPTTSNTHTRMCTSKQQDNRSFTVRCVGTNKLCFTILETRAGLRGAAARTATLQPGWNSAGPSKQAGPECWITYSRPPFPRDFDSTTAVHDHGLWAVKCPAAASGRPTGRSSAGIGATRGAAVDRDARAL